MFYPDGAVAYGYEIITDTLPRCMFCFICACKVLTVPPIFSNIYHQKRIQALDTLGADFLAY